MLPQGPHLGTFFSFWVPIFSIQGLRTREKSMQPLSSVDHLQISLPKSACSFWQDCLYPISHYHFLSFNTLSSSEIYHITILRDVLIKYRPFKSNIDHKFKNIDHLRQVVDYRPMVDNIDPLASLLMVFNVLV